MSKHLNIFMYLLLASAVFGCGKGFQPSTDIGSNRTFFRESTSSLFIPEQDRVDDSCSSSGEICIFLKNPVFQTQHRISPDDSPSLLSSQTFSAKLTNVDRSGYLKNVQFDIQSISRDRLSLSQALRSKGLSGKDGLYLSAYYWLNRAHEYLGKHFVSYPSKNRTLKVFVDDSFEGFVWGKDSLHLSENKKSAYSADVILALFGEAQLGYATNGSVFKFSSLRHKSCSMDPTGCCTSQVGCGKSILRGVGNYFVSMLFVDAARIGEFFGQDLKGQTICAGHFRSMVDFKNITLSQAFHLCGTDSGNVMAMGMVYASIWWEVRSKFDGQTVDALFLKHLNLISQDDTFFSLIAKIRALCEQEMHSEISQAFQTEFNRRAL